eukprot:TRINITY_DN63233_c0_g1_i1.p1 TRINITY_DN63233_c0_g1~~TRINITY_DN63233_c0_g1_i1.p1  ORF type:complete len:439 (-),score=76.52 TRINITY_DN63233_c0_g1_i1:70-1386(-)
MAIFRVLLGALLFTGSNTAKLRTDVNSQGVNELAKRDYSVKLQNRANVQYSGDFTFGTESIPVVYDTGSFEVLVLSEDCQKCSKSLRRYNQKLSKTFVMGGMTAEHDFVSGSATTKLAFETLKMGHQDSPAVTQNQSFWMVEDVDLSFWKRGNAIFSGIVGLSHSEEPPKNFLGNPKAYRSLLGSMKVDSFSICLQRGGSNAPGYVKFGQSIDSMQSQYPGAFQTVPVQGGSHWAAGVNSFKVDGFETSWICSQGCNAIVDSGTSLISIPAEAKHISEKLKHQIKSDCSNINELPALILQLGNATVSIPPKAYVFRFGGACKSGFMDISPTSQFADTFLLGMPFLRYYYTIFDAKNKQLHMARADEKCNIAPVGLNDIASNKTNTSSLFAATNSLEVSLHEGNAQAGSFAMAGLSEADFSEATEGNLDEAILPLWASA